MSIKVPKSLGCKCHGIDAIPECIEYAQQKEQEFEVTHLCTFETGDVSARVDDFSGKNIIILGAIGPVFGDYYSTLTTLSKCLNENGIFIIDDGYIENDSDYSHPLILKQETIRRQIDKAGLQLIDDDIVPQTDIKDSDNYIFENLEKRCNE